jgi:hypothetical protein
VRFGLTLILLSAAVAASAAPRVDNVLVRMVPPGVNSLVGAHMDQVVASDLYKRLVSQQKLPQLDQFARDTGFDPRRDVREILIANTLGGSVLLARGTFGLKQEPLAGMKLVRRAPYNIHVLDNAGYCILDSTLAAAGDIGVLEAALEEWQHGSHTAAQPLLATLAALSGQTQVWGVSKGFSNFLTVNLPRAGNGIDFSVIFKGIEHSWFTASVTAGFQGAIHVTTATDTDAVNLRDTAKGLVGLGRLSVPQEQPDLLRFWDGITVDQAGRDLTLDINIPGDMVDQMVRMLSAPGGRGGRGGSGGRGRGSRGGTGGRGRSVL